jgi:hypothetical protein
MKRFGRVLFFVDIAMTPDKITGKRAVTGFYSWPPPHLVRRYAGGESMRINDDVKKLAVYVGKDWKGGVHWSGTGFFVGIPHETNPDRVFRYFVTASHVADEVEGSKFFLRVNNTSGGADQIGFPPDHKWYRHPSKYTDVAVFPYDIDGATHDFGSLVIGQFLTDATIRNRSIGVGDEIVIVGLFTKHPGSEVNTPLIRLGNLAMFPDVSVLAKTGVDRKTVVGR